MQTHSTNQASAAAFAQVGNLVLKAEADKILDIVLAAQRNGANDLTRREIQKRYEVQHGKHIESSSVSARVHALVLAGRLKCGPVDRVCSVSGKMVGTVLVPMTQTRLVG